MKKRKPKPFIDEHTSSVTIGPISLDVQDARRQGWNETQIERCFDAIAAAFRKESRLAARRRGLTRKCETCDCWTSPSEPCHSCKLPSLDPNLN